MFVFLCVCVCVFMFMCVCVFMCVCRESHFDEGNGTCCRLCSLSLCVVCFPLEVLSTTKLSCFWFRLPTLVPRCPGVVPRQPSQRTKRNAPLTVVVGLLTAHHTQSGLDKRQSSDGFSSSHTSLEHSPHMDDKRTNRKHQQIEGSVGMACECRSSYCVWNL